MRNFYFGILILCLITMLVSLYYGTSIQDAQDNFLVEHLYEDEGIDNFDLDYIPTLSFKAAFVTLFFLLFAFILQFIILIRTTFKSVKYCSILALCFFSVIFIFDVLTLFCPHDYNFKNFGMIWVLLSLSIIFISMVGVFTKKQQNR